MPCLSYESSVATCHVLNTRKVPASCQGTPPILADCLRWLAGRALHVPFLFSSAMPVDVVQALLYEFDNGFENPLSYVDEPVAVSGLLKYWLATLCIKPLPAEFMYLELNNSFGQVRSALQKLLPIQLAIAKPLLLFLQQYALRQHDFDVELAALSTAFSSTLIEQRNAHDLRSSRVLAYLIRNALDIFAVPSYLCETKAALDAAEHNVCSPRSVLDLDDDVNHASSSILAHTSDEIQAWAPWAQDTSFLVALDAIVERSCDVLFAGADDEVIIEDVGALCTGKTSRTAMDALIIVATALPAGSGNVKGTARLTCAIVSAQMRFDS